MSPPMTYEDLLKSISLQGLVFGHMPCAVWAGRTPALSGQAPAHASLSARQAKEKGLLTSGTYGPPCIGWSGSADLSLSLANNLQVLTLTTGSTLYKLTWKVWDMPSGRVRFRLRASVRRTSATELTGWPTPTASDHKGGYQGGRVRNGKLSTDRLDVAAQLAEPIRLTDSGKVLTGCSAGMESGGQLSPAHSRWLMALPPEWDVFAPTETLSTLKRQQRS